MTALKGSLLIALIIAVTGQVLYHVAQKSVASDANPVISLLVFYGAAAVLTLPLLFFFPTTRSLSDEFSSLNWAVIAVAASIVLIEIGFLLAYRAGGSLSGTFILTAAIVTMCTLFIGVLFFKESISIGKVIGVAMCLGGIALISSKH
jgi:drug/metabolite transporter (DMT)-like permease